MTTKRFDVTILLGEQMERNPFQEKIVLKYFGEVRTKRGVKHSLESSDCTRYFHLDVIARIWLYNIANYKYCINNTNNKIL